MNKRWTGLAGIGLGIALLTGSAMTAGAFDSSAATHASTGSRWGHVTSHLVNTVSDFDPFETTVAPGTIDDGKNLLPQAKITLDEAIKAAQSTGDGALGEVDLEYVNDHLVFNIDIGNTDVQVDALDGTILASLADD